MGLQITIVFLFLVKKMNIIRIVQMFRFNTKLCCKNIFLGPTFNLNYFFILKFLLSIDRFQIMNVIQYENPTLPEHPNNLSNQALRISVVKHVKPNYF